MNKEAKRNEMLRLMKELDKVFKSGEIRENFGKIAMLSGKIDKLANEIRNGAN